MDVMQNGKTACAIAKEKGFYVSQLYLEHSSQESHVRSRFVYSIWDQDLCTVFEVKIFVQYLISKFLCSIWNQHVCSIQDQKLCTAVEIKIFV